jgi:hypothetical protein
MSPSGRGGTGSKSIVSAYVVADFPGVVAQPIRKNAVTSKEGGWGGKYLYCQQVKGMRIQKDSWITRFFPQSKAKRLVAPYIGYEKVTVT